MSLEVTIAAQVEAAVTHAMMKFIYVIPDQFYTPEEIAKIIKVDPETVRRLCHNGEIKYSKLGRSIRVSPADLDNYFKQNRVN